MVAAFGAEPGGIQGVGQPGHEEGRGQGIKEWACPAGTEKAHDKPHQNAAHAAAQGVYQAAAKEQSKAPASQKISKSPHQGRIGFGTRQGVRQLLLSILGVGPGLADPAAEGAEPLQAV